MPAPDEPERFFYHRAVAPPLWMLVGLAGVELCVTHLLTSLLWSRTAALLLSVVTLASVAWFAGVIRSMKRLPVLLGPQGLVMRAGSLRGVAVPLAEVAGVRADWDGAALRGPGVLKLSLLAHPNVLVDLRTPVGRHGRTRTIARRLDDPAAFTAAMERLGARP